ncbi:MAG TPA: DUF4124 domain-containing protein [Usitatibacter sp.]|nr:DUF4124 domain-containing protein [Usitatibacter sp.]
MSRAVLAICAPLLAAAFASSAHAEIFRCTSPAGGVTYQQSPCSAREAAKRLDIPDAFPAVDTGERERLLAREAALDRRLEAQRERESREAMARAAQAPAAPPQAAPEPAIAWMLAPPFIAQRHSFGHRFPAPRRGAHPLGR